MKARSAGRTRRVHLWPAAGLLFAASCLDADPGSAILRSASNDVPCPWQQLAIVSRPGVGRAGTYIVEGCQQRLTYRIDVQSSRAELVTRVALSPNP